MLNVFLRFVRGLSSNLAGALGVALVNATFVTFVAIEVLRLTGIVQSAYVGMVSYLFLPPIFVSGLLLIPLGWWIYVRRVGRPWR
ncbi:MAG: hypothetical protein HN348_19670, partial [Proteobacteria bacterium]|nr:hypothetical protein [Pseudomonadota bacterium]